MTTNQFPELSDLLGSYFHQDWPAEFPTDEAALQTIVEGESLERLKRAVAEIEVLLSAGLSEDALRSVAMAELGCFFEPQSWKEWFGHVKHRFEKNF